MQHAHTRVRNFCLNYVTPSYSRFLRFPRCGGAIGVYFLVKRCSLLYIYANNGTFSQSPYLDVHGEVDVSMRCAIITITLVTVLIFPQFATRRGRRQYLHHARWEDVRKAWLNHGVPTVVARKLESTVDSGGWETL